MNDILGQYKVENELAVIVALDIFQASLCKISIFMIQLYK